MPARRTHTGARDAPGHRPTHPAPATSLPAKALTTALSAPPPEPCPVVRSLRHGTLARVEPSLPPPVPAAGHVEGWFSQLPREPGPNHVREIAGDERHHLDPSRRDHLEHRPRNGAAHERVHPEFGQPRHSTAREFGRKPFVRLRDGLSRLGVNDPHLPRHIAHRGNAVVPARKACSGHESVTRSCLPGVRNRSTTAAGHTAAPAIPSSCRTCGPAAAHDRSGSVHGRYCSDSRRMPFCADAIRRRVRPSCAGSSRPRRLTRRKSVVL